MPVYYQIDRATTIRTRCVGPVTMGEVAGHFRALEVDSDCPDFADVLLDLRKPPRRREASNSGRSPTKSDGFVEGFALEPAPLLPAQTSFTAWFGCSRYSRKTCFARRMLSVSG